MVVHQVVVHDYSQGLPRLEDLDAGARPGVGDDEVSLGDVLSRAEIDVGSVTLAGHLLQGGFVLVGLDVDVLDLLDVREPDLGAGPGLQGEGGAAQVAETLQHRGREHGADQRVELKQVWTAVTAIYQPSLTFVVPTVTKTCIVLISGEKYVDDYGEINMANEVYID